jgi:hypothetical protein
MLIHLFRRSRIDLSVKLLPAAARISSASHRDDQTCYEPNNLLTIGLWSYCSEDRVKDRIEFRNPHSGLIVIAEKYTLIAATSNFKKTFGAYTDSRFVCAGK